MDTIASTKNPFHAFQHELDTFSTGFQQRFAFFDKLLVFFVFASKIRQLLITRRAVTLRRRQETCCKSSPLYREACCHFAPPTATCLTWAVKKEACLSLCAIEQSILQTKSKGNFCLMTL
jgi:hypothetical protein